MNDKNSKTSDAANEIKQQAKNAADKILALASKKYHINFEIYGWAIALVVLILLIILVR
ncbi:MAG TPA: hypothetical protein VGL10_08930 [Gammaproteobacteria bacterium]